MDADINKPSERSLYFRKLSDNRKSGAKVKIKKDLLNFGAQNCQKYVELLIISSNETLPSKMMQNWLRTAL